MKIAIDVTPLVGSQLGGTARYARHLLKGLTETDKENEYLIYLDRDWQHDNIKVRDNFSIWIPGGHKSWRNSFLSTNCAWMDLFYRYGLMEQMILPRYLKNDRVNLFHSTVNALPLTKVCKFIATIHYVTPTVHPEHAGASLYLNTINFLHRVFTPLMVNKADRVIAVCESIKKDVMQVYNYPEERIRVITPSVDEIFRVISKQEAEKVKNKYGIPEDYILYLDHASWHYEMHRFFEAFCTLKKVMAVPHKLVLAGNFPPAHLEYIRAFIEARELSDEVIQTGFVPDEDLVQLYNAATLLVYPLTYEGFGIVPLEAMACGTPVIAITSTAPMVREMVGDAGIIIDSHNLNALIQAMYTVLTDRKFRSKMVEKGLRRAEQSNWRMIARKTLDVYKELLEELPSQL